jgi:hypothetical protein
VKDKINTVEKRDARDERSALDEHPASTRDALPRDKAEPALGSADATSDFKTALGSIRDFERFVRAHLKCSSRQAKVIAASSFNALTRPVGGDAAEELLADLRQFLRSRDR